MAACRTEIIRGLRILFLFRVCCWCSFTVLKLGMFAERMQGGSAQQEIARSAVGTDRKNFVLEHQISATFSVILRITVK